MTLTTKPFSLRVEANDKILSMLPNDWEDYFLKIVSPHEEVVLRIKEDADLGNLICSVGWSKRLWMGKEQAVFAPKGKALFSLAYNLSNNEVEICVKKHWKALSKMALFMEC